MYHERQSFLHCAVHSLNNLLQFPCFTSSQFNSIASSLHSSSSSRSFSDNSFLSSLQLFNPHKSIFGIGNFDVNVIEIALNSIEAKLEWVDSRSLIQEFTINIENEADSENSNFVGLLLNEPNNGWFGLNVGRHWKSIKRLNGAWIDLDSKLKKPEKIENLIVFINKLKVKHGNQMILFKVRKENKRKTGESEEKNEEKANQEHQKEEDGHEGKEKENNELKLTVKDRDRDSESDSNCNSSSDRGEKDQSTQLVHSDGSSSSLPLDLAPVRSLVSPSFDSVSLPPE